VVGAGIIGLAVARRLSEARPGAVVTVLEKEPEIAAHQTRRNSGVVHAGIYYAPGSLKARLCRRGVDLLRTLRHFDDTSGDGELVLHSRALPARRGCMHQSSQRSVELDAPPGPQKSTCPRGAPGDARIAPHDRL